MKTGFVMNKELPQFDRNITKHFITICFYTLNVNKRLENLTNVNSREQHCNLTDGLYKIINVRKLYFLAAITSRH